MEDVAVDLKFSINYDEAEEFEWMDKLEASARVGNKVIMYCQTKLIIKSEIRPNFWENMDGPSQETSKFAVDLFGRYGQLRSIYVDHEINEAQEHGVKSSTMATYILSKRSLSRSHGGARVSPARS